MGGRAMGKNKQSEGRADESKDLKRDSWRQHRLSECPVLAVLSWLSCLGCLILAVLS